jgi:hypothetical protein
MSASKPNNVLVVVVVLLPFLKSLLPKKKGALAHTPFAKNH